MDVGSPGNGYDTINDFLKDDDSALPDDLDVGFIVNKDIVDDDVYSDSGVNDKSHLDLSEKEKPEVPSLSSTLRHYDVPGSPSEKVRSYLESGFHHDTLDKRDSVGDRGKFHTQYNENLHHDDYDRPSSSYFHDSIFEMDPEPILHEKQNDDSDYHQLEPVSVQDHDMQQYILDKPASPANAEIGEHTYVEAVQNESAQSGCVSRDTDEGVPMHHTEKLCISPVSPLRDPETNSHKVHELINSSRGCKYLAPSHFDKKNHGSSPEPDNAPTKNIETLGSPNVSGSSYQSTDIHDIQPGYPAKSNQQISSPTNKQTPSTIVPNQIDPPQAEPLNLASSHGMELMSQHIENSPAEHVITSPSGHYRVNGEMLQSSIRRQKSSCVHKADYRNRSYSRSSRHSKGCKKRSHDLGPSMSHSIRSEKLCPPHEGLVQPLSSSKSSEQKHASRSPTPQDQPLKSQNSSASQGGVVVLPSSLSRLCRQKPGSARRSNHRRSSSRSLYIGGGHKDLLDASLSVDRCSRSHKVSSSGEGDTQFPSSRSVEQKNISSLMPHRNGSRSRSPHTRYHHKRPRDTAQTEQLSQRKKLFALQGSVQLSSLSRSGKQKHELDDKSTSFGVLSMSPHNGDHCKTSLFHADSSTGRLHSRQKESALQGDHGQSSSSRLRSNRPGSVETYKRKRSQSRSPCTGDNKRSKRAHHPSSSQNVSAQHESLLQPYESAERQNLGLCSINPAEPMHSASPWSSRQRPINSSSAKGAPELHRNHCTHHNHGHRGRSISPLHIRRKDFSRESKVDIPKRSLSKSPGRRDIGKFPRKRHSPRHRSPQSYHSLRSTPRRTHWSPPHDRSTGLGKPGRGLFVAGFSFITTERDLERKFSRFGRVRDVRIVRDKRSGDSRGFGFLTLERDEQADAAIRALDKTEWDGRIVLVEKSKSH
ncbi:serine/arginine repetitive matrix protein 2-like [Sesamum indicum]|uniref:Serine/arginine repetitive matrix protein 2-like n=1 Tax=Sesamum indicum TaxID=4182 RepID=A0A6I9ULT3_SESIN|nr:serine/arginine repetitive matrix protein 2-like [Sesamum indicum]